MAFDYSAILSLIQTQSYLIIFILMFIEGPTITSIAAFVASLGLLNIWIILFLSMFGNLVPDILLYSFGRFARNKDVESFVNKMGLNEQRTNALENKLKEHAVKTIVFVKLTPMLPVPGLILTGFAKISFKKFFVTIFLFNVISAIIFTSIGFYSGFALNLLLKYFKLGEYFLLFTAIFFVLIYFIYKKIYKIIQSKVKN